MSGKKRVNPRRQPVTKASMKRDMRRASDSMLTMCLYAMLDAGADVEFIKRFTQKFSGVASQILDNRLPVWMLRQTVEDDYEKELAALEAEGVRAFFMDTNDGLNDEE